MFKLTTVLVVLAVMAVGAAPGACADPEPRPQSPGTAAGQAGGGPVRVNPLRSTPPP